MTAKASQKRSEQSVVYAIDGAEFRILNFRFQISDFMFGLSNFRGSGLGIRPCNEHVLDVDLLVFGGNWTPPHLVSPLGFRV